MFLAANLYGAAYQHSQRAESIFLGPRREQRVVTGGMKHRVALARRRSVFRSAADDSFRSSLTILRCTWDLPEDARISEGWADGEAAAYVGSGVNFAASQPTKSI